MKQKIQKHKHDAPEKLDLFRDTFRGKMPLTDDYVFHAVFGRDTAESKGALMEILNIILARKQDPIRAIVIKNPIETPEREMEKGTVMDIKAETDAGELLNIEMQANSFSFYQSRALFYGGRLVNSSLQGGEKYDKMRKSIVVSIIDGNLFPELDSCHNIFAVREKNSGLLLSDRVEFHFLELQKIDVTKPVHSLTEVERLGAYLKYASDEEYQDYVRQILSEEDMDMTENTYRKVSQDELEYERREARLKYQLQYNTEISVAREQGLAQGLKKGEAAGLKKGEAVGLKKGEAQKDSVKPWVDCVMTFQELQALIDSRDFEVSELEESHLDNASYFGRVFARSGGVSDAVQEALKEQGIDFTVKPAVCDGIEQCRMALLKASRGALPENFIEGMACIGGCIGGAGCLTHGAKDKSEVDKYGMEAFEKTISDAIKVL